MKTIRRQLTRKLLLTVGLLLGAGCLTVYVCARAALQGEFDAGLRAKAQALATLTEQKGSRLEMDFSDEHMPAFEKGGADFFELWDAEGRTVERSRSLRDGHLPFRHGTLEKPVFWNLKLPEEQGCRAVGFKFRPQHADGPAGERFASERDPGGGLRAPRAGPHPGHTATRAGGVRIADAGGHGGGGAARAAARAQTPANPRGGGGAD